MSELVYTQEELFDDIAEQRKQANKLKVKYAYKPKRSQYDYVLYTDGGSRENNLGAYGVRVDSQEQLKLHVDSHTYFGVTNNQMELKGLIEGLKWFQQWDLTDQRILLISDSQYLIYALSKGWLKSWYLKGRLNSGADKPVKNPEYWQQIIDLLENFDHLQVHWVKGHAHTNGNNYVDKLLNLAMDRVKNN